MHKYKKASLVLENGTVFQGYSFGSDTSISGEVVFNTGMMGYPESLTDPSYKGQILTLTYPLIGNYGIPDKSKENGLLSNFESDRIHVQGLVISDYSEDYFHWNAEKSLGDWLKEERIPGIFGIDTRALTKILREKGTMLGKIIIEDEDVAFSDPSKINLVAEVSINEKVVYGKGKEKILIVDCGCKYNIIRCFLKRGVSVIRVPWDYDFSNEEFDGLFISNGPGDPKLAEETIANVREYLKIGKPVFGICLGNQILGLAAGGDTFKLKYGHRSQNQPCVEVGTKRCYITSQNHGYALDTKSLPPEWSPWFVNANDNTNEGVKHENKPFFSVQFHPEAMPGPMDTEFLFDRFIDVVKKWKNQKK